MELIRVDVCYFFENAKVAIDLQFEACSRKWHKLI